VRTERQHGVTCSASLDPTDNLERTSFEAFDLDHVQGNGVVLGLIAMPVLLINASSPTIVALIVDQVGWPNEVYPLLSSSIGTWIAIELMSR
jgi:hypothetical protein